MEQIIEEIIPLSCQITRMDIYGVSNIYNDISDIYGDIYDDILRQRPLLSWHWRLYETTIRTP